MHRFNDITRKFSTRNFEDKITDCSRPKTKIWFLLPVEKKCVCLGVEEGKNWWKIGDTFWKTLIDPQMTKLKNIMSPIIKVCAKTG